LRSSRLLAWSAAAPLFCALGISLASSSAATGPRRPRLWLAIIGVSLAGFQETAPAQRARAPLPQERRYEMIKTDAAMAGADDRDCDRIERHRPHCQLVVASRRTRPRCSCSRSRGPVIERGSDGFAWVGRRQSDPAQRGAPHGCARRPANPRIVGLAVRITDPEMEFAQAQELSGLIRDFRGPSQVDHGLSRKCGRLSVRVTCPTWSRARAGEVLDDA